MSFFRKIIFWFVGMPIAVVVAGFSVANRSPIIVSFDPFENTHPFYSLEMPIYIFGLVSFFAGFAVGALFVWNSQRKWRNEARFRKFDVSQHKHEVEYYKKKAKQKETGLIPLGLASSASANSPSDSSQPSVSHTK